MSLLKDFQIRDWSFESSSDDRHAALTSLEEGSVLTFPHLDFLLEDSEKKFLNPAFVDPSRKNISYDKNRDLLGGSLWKEADHHDLKKFLSRYSTATEKFLHQLLPAYRPHLKLGKTTLRPVEIEGRKASVHKDDTRLHVDAFPSNPTSGERILRFFTNINLSGKPRVWRVGEPFDRVANRFSPLIRPPIPGTRSLLKLLKITKKKRTLYDHYMLHIHNKMKEDEHYQTHATQEQVILPSQTSWMVFTDQVSHAAMSGQHVLEQTFHLSAHALTYPERSPLKILEKKLQRSLV